MTSHERTGYLLTASITCKTRVAVLLIVSVLAVDFAFAQSPPDLSFETASIRPSKSDDLKSGFRAAGEQFTASNVRVQDLIRVAYQLRINDERLLGVPDWARTATYTVIAKAPAGITLTPSHLVPDGSEPSTLALMVRGLLAERFGLKMHTETRSMPGYALAVAPRPEAWPKSWIAARLKTLRNADSAVRVHVLSGTGFQWHGSLFCCR